LGEHYFTRNPTAKSDVRFLTTNVRGLTLAFRTDAGVFSRSGLDFGTRLLIECMHIPAHARVLDVGCGYGPIGIAAAKLEPTARVTMIDVNERAVALAAFNASQNGVPGIRVLAGDGFAPVLGEAFDVILTNPPVRAGKAVVYRLFEQAARHLAPGGAFWVVMRKQQGALSAFEKLKELFPDADVVNRRKGYYVFRASGRA